MDHSNGHTQGNNFLVTASITASPTMTATSTDAPHGRLCFTGYQRKVVEDSILRGGITDSLIRRWMEMEGEMDLSCTQQLSRQFVESVWKCGMFF